MEQSVSRADLQDYDAAPSSPESIALDQLNAFDEIEFVQPLDGTTQDVPGDVDDEEVAFRLFAPTSQSEAKAATQTIRLKSPTPLESQEGGFVRPDRNQSYYFTSTSGSFEQAAVSAADVQRLAAIKWTGMALPWKVLNLPSSQVTRAAKQGLQVWDGFVDESISKRRRPGKKARIKLRVKVAAQKTKAIEMKAALEAKDAAQREKKTRLNREKKAKKRQREKAKKAAAKAGDADGDHDMNDEDDSEAESE